MAIIKDPLTGEVKEKSTTDFSSTERPLTSAAAYSQRIMEKQQKLAAAKSMKVPLGHAPPIPEGKLAPIVEAARAGRMPQPDFGLPVPPPEKQEEWAQVEEDKPPLIQGVGSAYAVNQAISTGAVDRPVNMRQAKEMAEEAAAKKQPKKQMHPETQKLLQMQHDTVREAEDDSTSVETAPVMSANKEVLDSAEKQLAENKYNDLLALDFEALQQARVPLLNRERKKAIEDRLPPLNFEDLITKREIIQDVPIIPGKFSVGFRTVREKEYVWVLQHLYEVTGVSSTAHIEELSAAFRLVCAVRSINGRLLPDHRDNVGQPDEEVNVDKFKKKLDILMGFPMHVYADMGINYNWFLDRVTALFSVDNVKNG